jgi:hypothetical protein
MLGLPNEPENLIELHEQLNKFARYHQNKGGQEAHRIIKELWDGSHESVDGSELGKARDEGFDNAIKWILSELHKRFVP